MNFRWVGRTHYVVRILWSRTRRMIFFFSRNIPNVDLMKSAMTPFGKCVVSFLLLLLKKTSRSVTLLLTPHHHTFQHFGKDTPRTTFKSCAQSEHYLQWW